LVVGQTTIVNPFSI